LIEGTDITIELEIASAGKISGDDISFSAERPFGIFAYTGKIKGNEIVLKVSFNDQTFEMTAKRMTN
jgi:hypothetical protein